MALRMTTTPDFAIDRNITYNDNKKKNKKNAKEISPKMSSEWVIMNVLMTLSNNQMIIIITP